MACVRYTLAQNDRVLFHKYRPQILPYLFWGTNHIFTHFHEHVNWTAHDGWLELVVRVWSDMYWSTWGGWSMYWLTWVVGLEQSYQIGRPWVVRLGMVELRTIAPWTIVPRWSTRVGRAELVGQGGWPRLVSLGGWPKVANPFWLVGSVWLTRGGHPRFNRLVLVDPWCLALDGHHRVVGPVLVSSSW